MKVRVTVWAEVNERGLTLLTQALEQQALVVVSRMKGNDRGDDLAAGRIIEVQPEWPATTDPPPPRKQKRRRSVGSSKALSPTEAPRTCA